MATLAFEIGFCGFGVSDGVIPELRLGVLRVWVCQGSVVDRLREYQAALNMAWTRLRDLRG